MGYGLIAGLGLRLQGPGFVDGNVHICLVCQSLLMNKKSVTLYGI